MGTYKVRVVTWEDREIDEADLVTMREAADLVGVAIQTVQSEIERGQLTAIIDPDNITPRQGRRLVLLSELEEWKARRLRGGRKKRPDF